MSEALGLCNPFANEDLVRCTCAWNIVAFLKMKCTCWQYNRLLANHNCYNFVSVEWVEKKRGHRLWRYAIGGRIQRISTLRYGEELQMYFNLPNNINIIWKKTKHIGQRQLKCSLSGFAREFVSFAENRTLHPTAAHDWVHSEESPAWFLSFSKKGVLQHHTSGRCTICYQDLHMTIRYTNSKQKKRLFEEDRIMLTFRFSPKDRDSLLHDITQCAVQPCTLT